MRRCPRGEPRCTYLVALGRENRSMDDLCELAAYLSQLAVSGVDVLIVDASFPLASDCNRRVLRWVGRYVVAQPQHLTASGSIDPIRAAADLASSDKIIFANPQVRYTDEALGTLCHLLELHEVVEPQDYFDPLPWWSCIEAGRMLVRRGIGPLPHHASTFGFRKRALRGIHGIGGAELFAASHLFVRRKPPTLAEWVRDRALQVDESFAATVMTAFFIGILPIALALLLLGGVQLAADYAGAIALGALALAVRGRIGAADFFPCRACFYAPLWVFERSLSVYWALLGKLTGAGDGRTPAIARNERSASGESPPAARTR